MKEPAHLHPSLRRAAIFFILVVYVLRIEIRDMERSICPEPSLPRNTDSVADGLAGNDGEHLFFSVGVWNHEGTHCPIASGM